jgi:hypothetical protein
MAEKREYKVVQNQGKITWSIEELWPGGVVRSPYGTKAAAILAAEKLAAQYGYANDLILAEADSENVSIEKAFEKDEEGTWTCVEACSLNINQKELVLGKGLTFSKGVPYMGVDVAEWLENNLRQ